MGDTVIEALLAGFSTGLFCGTTCLPFMAPYLVAENRGFSSTALIWLQFMLGRLGGYILFGALFGYLGQKITQSGFNLISVACMMLMSLVLLLYAVGLFKPKWDFCLGHAPLKKKVPVVMGFLMGVNICPPFLMSAAYVFTLHSTLKGIVYFLIFFAATSVYFLPMIFLGFLGRMNEFRFVARASAIAVGILFTVYGIFAISRGLLVIHTI